MGKLELLHLLFPISFHRNSLLFSPENKTNNQKQDIIKDNQKQLKSGNMRKNQKTANRMSKEKKEEKSFNRYIDRELNKRHRRNLRYNREDLLQAKIAGYGKLYNYPAIDEDYAKYKIKKYIWTFIKAMIIELLIIITVFVWMDNFFHPRHCLYSSMEPTSYDGDISFESFFAYNREFRLFEKTIFNLDDKAPERGDIISFTKPEFPNDCFGKRVIGIAGDVIKIKNGVVYRNGTRLYEDYVKDLNRDCNAGPFYIPENACFVLGDNRPVSVDSSCWNSPYVNYEDIIGKVVFYWHKK